MTESQNTEYKETWRDECLKWICGFANAQGGTVYIGVNDAGEVVGVKNIKKLLEDIPNKIQTGLGIVADVNKRMKDGKPKRSAVLLFYDDPAVVQVGSMVQVGKFGDDDDIQ